MFKTTKPASKHWSAILPVNTCGYAKDWAKKQKSAASAWATCERGDWMLWLLGKWCDSDVQHRRIVLAACDCARLSLKYVEPGEERPLRAIETAERWARGGDDAPSLAEVRSASIAAAASYAYAAYACSAYACSAHTFDAEFSAYACYAYATNAAYARTAVLKQCADIVRKHFPIAPAHGTLLALQEIANG